MNDKLRELIEKYPNHLVIEKALWVGDVKVDINHINNDLSQPLDLFEAFERMEKELIK